MVSDRLSLPAGHAFYGKFPALRPFQDAAVGPALRGEDILVLSGTGSGKTEAIVAPIVDRLMRERAFGPRHVSIIYITPTRALANDLIKRLRPPMEQLGLEVGIRHGEQNDVGRARKPDLLITTPESLDVMMTAREPAIRATRAIIVDEAHLFYNSQRGFQLAVLLERMARLVTSPMQVGALSATVASAEEIWAFLRPMKPVSVIRDPAVREIDYLLRTVDGIGQLAPLLDTIGSNPQTKALIFTNSRREADQIAAVLRNRTKFGDRVLVHHSSLSKSARLHSEAEFSRPGRAICIATSTLELGIDIGDIDVVLLYGHPGGWESFLQRIGRGNRRSSKSNVVAIATPDHGSVRFQQLAYEALVRQVRQGKFDREGALTLYGAGVQQVLSMLLETDGAFVRIADMLEVLGRWPGYSRDLLDRALDRLVDEEVIVRHGFQHRIGAGTGLHRLHDMRMIWGNFPARSRDVTIMRAGQELGRVPAVNALRSTHGSIFAFNGRRWVVKRVTPDRIEVELSSRQPTMTLSYGGSKPGLSASNIEAMHSYISDPGKPEGLHGEAASEFEAFVASLSAVTPNTLPYWRKTSGSFVYLTFAGRITNQVLVQALQADPVEVGDLFIETSTSVRFSDLADDISIYSDIASQALDRPLELTVYQGLLPVELLRLELGLSWSRSPVSRRTMARLRTSEPVQVTSTAYASILV